MLFSLQRECEQAKIGPTSLSRMQFIVCKDKHLTPKAKAAARLADEKILQNGWFFTEYWSIFASWELRKPAHGGQRNWPGN